MRRTRRRAAERQIFVYLARALGQHERVARVAARGVCHYRQLFVRVHRHVLQAVDGDVYFSAFQSLFELLREEPLYAEFIRSLGKRLHVHVARRRHRNELDLQLGMRRGHRVYQYARLSDGERALAASETDHSFHFDSSSSMILDSSSATHAGQTSRRRSARRRVSFGESAPADTLAAASPSVTSEGK